MGIKMSISDKNSGNQKTTKNSNEETMDNLTETQQEFTLVSSINEIYVLKPSYSHTEQKGSTLIIGETKEPTIKIYKDKHKVNAKKGPKYV
jgi:hypothetical protein